MFVQASLVTVRRVQAADQHPVAAAQKIRYLFQRAPGQRCPRFLFAQQQDKPVGGVAGDGEAASSRRSGEGLPWRDCSADRAFDSPCHEAIMAQLPPDVDALRPWVRLRRTSFVRPEGISRPIAARYGGSAGPVCVCITGCH